MDSFFTELGRTVRARWQEQNFALEVFPELARAALEEQPPAKHVDLPALIREFLLEDEQPFQTQSGFGQPELVVYDDPRFYIQILFWLDGTTDIHQHMFSGAFHVLAGSSIHSRFEFENVQSISAHLRVGDLRMTGTQLLETGRTESITSGLGYIHSLFHLESPSLTVVIRTHTDPGSGPQYTYLPPHVAVDPYHHDALTTRRKQLLDVLEQTEIPDYPDLVHTMLERLDFERGFFILQNGLSCLRACDAWEAAVAAFQKKHGPLAAGVAPTLDEIVRRDGIVALRSTITDPEHRFFLALLLNVPTRTDILQMVAQRFPEPPTATILRWAEELLDSSEFGTALLEAEFPTDLDVPFEDQPALLLATLQHGLDGESTGATSPEHFDTLRAVLLQSSLRALIA